MDNRQINKICKYVDTDFSNNNWEEKCIAKDGRWVNVDFSNHTFSEEYIY